MGKYVATYLSTECFGGLPTWSRSIIANKPHRRYHTASSLGWGEGVGGGSVKKAKECVGGKNGELRSHDLGSPLPQLETAKTDTLHSSGNQ